MDIEPQNFFHILLDHAQDSVKGPAECHRLLTILNYNLTEEQLNTALIDLYILHVFDRSNGLFKFVLETSSNSKFDNACVKALEIIFALINNFYQKVEEYVLDVNSRCLKVLQTKASARIKIKVLEVLIISFEKIDKGLDFQLEYTQVFEGIRACLIQAVHPNSVRQKEFTAVGLFAKKFSYLVSDSHFLKNYFLSELETSMVKGPSQSTIYGVFTGFSYFCESFPLNKDHPEDSAILQKLYGYIYKLAIAQCDQHYGNRAALVYFGTYMSLFENVVVLKYKEWHKILLQKWLAMGVDDKKVGEQTLRSLLFTLAGALSRMDKTQGMPILKHFIQWFKSILRKSEAPDSEKRLCMQGLNYFSRPLYEYYTKDEAREVFLMLMQSFERNFAFGEGAESEQGEFLPDYVQCLAGFMRYQSFSNSEVHCLQRAIINIIKTFDKLKPLHHSIIIECLVSTFFYLRQTNHFDSFIENIVYQGVVWSCSHQHISDADLTEEQEKIVTVKNYFPLWRGLLKMVSNLSYDKIAIYHEDRHHILTKLVNELVKTLMVLVNKLNVNVKLKEDVIQTDLQSAYQVEHPNDFNIFLNITDFYQEVLASIDAEMLRHCSCRIINHLIGKCLRYPLVSGFYKLLSFGLKIADSLKLFDGGSVTLNQDIANCKETLAKFLTSLLHRMKLFKDELLISCLYVLLESPVVVVEPLLPECAGIFITIFDLGRSYIALANIGLSTLEKWQQCMKQDDFEQFLLQVVSSLDSYLRSKSLGGLTQTAAIEKKRKTARMLKKRAVLVELDSELVQFQKRVLRFVGSQNSKVCEAFVSPDNNFERKVTSDNLHLKVTLPYNDIALEVYLEPFIMRVVDLCLYSSDRKTRVLACELLQAFVVVFLGRTKGMTESSRADLEDLFRNIALPLLQLACDIDKIVRDIFEPLFMQIIHWYTSRVQRESSHLAVIIDVLMDGVTHPTNAALRDFSGKCINEFVKWTIKQSSEDELPIRPTNIKVLIKMMRFYSGHPDLVKKLAAALFFNNIYKEIREERALISIFAIELLHIFVTSLELLDVCNEEVENTVIHISNAIHHLKRIFIEKSALFRTDDALRRVPSDIPQGNLIGVVRWLLTMTGSQSKYCRDISMDLFISIQPLSGSKTTLSSFAQENADGYLVSLYLQSLEKYPTLKEVDTKDAPALLKWLQALLCQLDGLTFIVKHSLCSINFANNIIMRSVNYFLENLQDLTIEQGLKLMCQDAALPYYTPENKEQYQQLKAACCLAVLTLAASLMNNINIDTLVIWTKSFWALILNAIFKPVSVGFDEKLGQSEHSLILRHLLDTLPRKLNSNLLGELISVLTDYVKVNFNVEIDLRRNVSLKQRSLLKGLLSIQGTQLDIHFKAKQFSKGLIDKLMNNFLTGADNNIVYIDRLSELTSEHCSLILEFALNDPDELNSLIEHLNRNLLVTCPDITENQMLFGVYLLTKFAEPLVKIILSDFDKLLNGCDSMELVFAITSHLLKYLDVHKEEFKGTFEGLSTAVLAKWTMFEAYFEDNNVDLGVAFIRHLWRLFSPYLPYTPDVQKWLLNLLCREEVLLTESEGIAFYLNVFEVLAEVADDDICDLRPALKTFQARLAANQSNSPATIDKLLNVLPNVKSQTVFKFLLELYLNDEPLDKSDADLSSLIKAFVAHNPEGKQLHILRTVYQLGLDKSKTFEQKKLLADKVLPYIFKECSYTIFQNFFEENIQHLTNGLENLSNYGDGLVYFSLLEILFLRIPIGSDERPNCSITEASGNPKLRTLLLKLSLDAFRDKTESENKNNLRVYKCFAYKALASIVSNSIKTPSLYEKLFVRKEKDEDILWNALIDTTSTYSFAVDFDSYPKKRKVLINIRDHLREQSSENKNKSLRYIESQRLFNSSLSEDVTKFDFTNSVIRSHGQKQENVDEDGQATFVQGEVFLESTEVNNHELMGTVCGVIGHMFSTGICQLPEDPEELVEFPNWMKGIAQLLLNPNSHPNIKIFWVKVIDNMIHIFRYFAKYFVEPLLQFLNDKVAGNSLNYFVSDVIVILATWSNDVKPSEKEAKLASNFLKYVIKLLTNDRQDSFKYNLDLVKLLVENWKDFIEVPHEGVSEKLKHEITNRQIEVGIHLTSIFLVNGLLPCEVSTLSSFWKTLIKPLGSTVSTIYKPCAETIGLLLKYLKLHEMERDSFQSELKMFLLKLQDVSKYAGCLEGVAIHYPEIVDEDLIIRNLSRLPQADPNLQTVFLKLICKRTDILGEISYFKSEEWDRYLESQNAAVQLITLEIILKTIGILKNEKGFKGILKSASKNILNPNSFCRGRMYDIMMAILENDIDDDDVLELCKEVLLQGLTDSDVEIREKIRTFWCENPVVPSDISQKFPYLLSNFYLAKTEDHFLGYMSYFLLESIKSDEYEKELFEHPLEDCDFEEYKLQTNWRLQHPSVVPMFAETLRSYSEDFDMVSGNLGALRGTQDVLTFAPTQQTTAREMHISQFTSLESSLFASRGEVSDFNKFLNPNDVQLSQKYKLNKRRFLKDKTKVSKGFAHRAVAQKQHEIVQRYDAAKEREKKVTIYRSYRKGDFPDIQITLGSIVKPLQMLVLNDSELAKTFFSVIYNTLKEKVKSSDNNFTFTVLSSIKRIFDTSIQYNTNVFSTLLDILLKSKGEFRLDPEIIAGVCQQSGLVSVGTLLIEEYIMNLDDIPSASKRGNGAADAETTHWLKLAGLYRELHEWDLVKTIFIEKSNCKEDVHRAIQFEGEKRWREAQETYESLIRTDFLAERQDFYYESYFKCLAHLGEWEKLPKAVEDLVPEGGEKTWGSLWSNDWFQQKILPWYISAQVKNILFTGNENQQFYIDLNASLSKEDQAQYLKSTFSEELCMLFLTRKENNQAMQYLKNGLENFLNEWQSLNPMFGTLRYDKVLNLRTLIEIERFLSTEKSLTEFTAEDNLRSLQAYWNSTRNEFLPSIILSESKLLYRRRFIKLLMEDLDRLGNKENLKKDLRKSQILLDISFMNLAVEESNYYMVRKYFRSYAEMNHPSLTMIYGSMACLYSNLAKKNPQLQVEKLLEGLTKFKQVVDSPKKDKVIASLLKIVDISEKVTEITHNNPDLYHRCDSILSEIFGSNRGSPLEAACDCLKSHILQIPLDSNKEDTIKEHAKALVKLAYFAQDKPDQEKDFVVFVLRAMKLGSKEARQLFPCILLKDSLADEVERDFIRESNGIPTWMFLGWIPQLLANVDTPKVAAIADIILRIAKAYPQAIMYSYRLSKASYSETLDESLDDTIRLVGELDALLLSDPLVDRFLEALSKVSIPLVTLTYYIKKMSATKDVQTSLIIINELMDFFFKATSDSRESSSMQGNMYKQIKDFKGEFQKLKEQTSLKALQDSLKIVENKLKTLLEKAKMSKELKDYCPWLANLSGGKLNMELEIPGQYSGDKLPLVQHHVKISGFRREVSVMISLRKPIKVTILGMDSKEYPFLIKFGEDIRQDQRIQQLFMLMNNIFANDNKSHHLLTYQVIPLTSSLGIIQWVDQTVSLESFIKRSVPNRRGDVFDSLRSKYQSFLGKNLFDLDGYGSMALKKKRDKVIPFFQSLVNLIPRDVLRTSIWKLSLSTESFIAFRDNFIKSYAINCVCHWILGIGDRHLQNFLVCTRNGKILGIDFGHAFGTATQALRIPELVPIRLTPHIVGLMEPLKERGALRNVMIDCLKSLRANRGPLLATMNVFIQEPSVDWLEQAKKFESSEHTWYPLEKLNQAKRKFGGTSSSTILIEDLKSSLLNHSRPQYIEAYVSLVKGDPQFDLRARLSTKENLSVEEQVDSLIDHATDQNLLGRMFAGWNAAV